MRSNARRRAFENQAQACVRVALPLSGERVTDGARERIEWLVRHRVKAHGRRLLILMRYPIGRRLQEF